MKRATIATLALAVGASAEWMEPETWKEWYHTMWYDDDSLLISVGCQSDGSNFRVSFFGEVKLEEVSDFAVNLYWPDGSDELVLLAPDDTYGAEWYVPGDRAESLAQKMGVNESVAISYDFGGTRKVHVYPLNRHYIQNVRAYCGA